jgi:hypothetical protein
LWNIFHYIKRSRFPCFMQPANARLRCAGQARIGKHGFPPMCPLAVRLPRHADQPRGGSARSAWKSQGIAPSGLRREHSFQQNACTHCSTLATWHGRSWLPGTVPHHKVHPWRVRAQAIALQELAGALVSNCYARYTDPSIDVCNTRRISSAQAPLCMPTTV